MRYYITSLFVEPKNVNTLDQVGEHIRLKLKIHNDEYNLPESVLYIPYSDDLFAVLHNIYASTHSFEINLSDLKSMADSAY